MSNDKVILYQSAINKRMDIHQEAYLYKNYSKSLMLIKTPNGSIDILLNI